MEDIDGIGYIVFADGYDADGNPTHKQEFITYKSKFDIGIDEYTESIRKKMEV